MTRPKIRPPKVGVVGSGQLGRMLIDAALNLNLKPHVLATRPDDPAALAVATDVTIGDSNDPGLLMSFIKDLDIVAFEHETRVPAVLAQVEQFIACNKLPVRILPTPKAFAICSDKIEQKQRLLANGLPTVAFSQWNVDQVALDEWLSVLSYQFPSGVVLKWASAGYDGRGILFAQPDELHSTDVRQFATHAANYGAALYAEALIPFKSELAVVCVRGLDGIIERYPTVVTVQVGGVCSEVRGPATACQVPKVAIEAAEAIAEEIGTLFDLVGTYAVEFFATTDGRVLVNEIAPRVHNSGHFSLDSAATSQFENHWRALLGRELGSTETLPFFAMINILGADFAPVQMPQPFSLRYEGINSYWYAKRESRPRRKLGHVNITASSPAELAGRVDVVKSAISNWQATLRGERR